MNEKNIVLLHYISGLVILVAGAIHIYTLFFTAPGFKVEINLGFGQVLAVYRNFFLASSLEALLISTAFHALNGLRVILIELHQGRLWEKAVTWALIVLGVIIFIYGTRTIILASHL